MHDELIAYFNEHVIAQFQTFLQRFDENVAGMDKDKLAAINSAQTLYHFREHLPTNYTKTRDEVASKCPDYDLAGDIANVSKHKNITRGNPQILSVDSIYEQTDIIKCKDADGEYFTCKKHVHVKLNDGSVRDVLEILTNVTNYWFKELHTLGILTKSNQFSTEEKEFPPPRTDSNQLDLEMIQGIRFNKNFRLVEYNYDTDELEPIDLTNSKVAFTIRKPEKYTLEMELNNKETGEKIKKEVSLSEKEYNHWNNLNTDAEKNNYLFNLAIEKGLINIELK